jgi:catechol 2,3-dioxygenase-like lactoylglutathione lyase family enzyme
VNPDPQPTRQPAIVAPAARYIGVADTARSIVFYRDVLRFEVHEGPDGVEASYGPARVHLGIHGFAPIDWEHPRPPGSAILFLETDDVAAMHAAIRARGGQPSDVEKVNWIKMQMFQVHDRDGNTLWFGQSYNVPDPLPRPRMLQKLCRSCRSTMFPPASRTTGTYSAST